MTSYLSRLAVGLAALCCLLPRPGRAAPSSADSLSSAWATAISTFEKGDALEASHLFASWIDEAKRQGIRSPEALYNLGLSEWATKQPGPGVFHVAESTDIRNSPVGVLHSLTTLAEMERELGIQEPVSETFSFRLRYLIDRDDVTLLATIAFWLVVGAWLLRWKRGRAAGDTPLVLIAFAIFFSLIAFLGSANRQLFGYYGVLDGDISVPLYKEADRSEAKKLAELPAGMIVAFGRAENGGIELYRPVSGWVPETAVRRLSDDP